MPIDIQGVGRIGPGTPVVREILPPLPPEDLHVLSCGEFEGRAELSRMQQRRASRLAQMVLLAARDASGSVTLDDPENQRAISIATGLGGLQDTSVMLENLIAKDERDPMPTRFTMAVHNHPAAQVAIDLDAHGMNSAPTAGETSFESALWQGMAQLAAGVVDDALVGAADELNDYPLAIGSRWSLRGQTVHPGEGAAVIRIVPAAVGTARLARLERFRLGRWQRPFDVGREADWVTETTELRSIEFVLTGAGGWPPLDRYYEKVVAELSARAGKTLEHSIYKDWCGDFLSASAFGFIQAVERVQAGAEGVLLYTLAARGSKALCLIRP